MENTQGQSPDRPASHQGFGREAVKQLGGAQAQDTGGLSMGTHLICCC